MLSVVSLEGLDNPAMSVVSWRPDGAAYNVVSLEDAARKCCEFGGDGYHVL